MIAAVGPPRTAPFTAARLTVRLHRSAVVGVAAIALLTIGLVGWFVLQLDGSPDAARCIALVRSSTATDADLASCQAYLELSGSAGRVVPLVVIFPLVVGLFIGVPLVAHELDQGTTTLAWSLEPSRLRWLLQRTVPMVLLALALGLAVGLAADRLEASLEPGFDPWASFNLYGLRGPVVAGRTVLVLGVALLVGALLGRTLPALMVAAAVSALLILGMTNLHHQVLEREAVVELPDGPADYAADLVLDHATRLPSGEVLTFEQLMARFGDSRIVDEQIQQPGSRSAVVVIPAERYLLVATREAVANVAVGLALVGFAVPVVTRRRPDPGRVRLPLRSLALPGRRRVRGSDAPPGPVTAARLAFWPHRAELVAGVVLGALASLGGVALLAAFTELSAPLHCIEDRFLVPVPPECATTEQYLTLVNEWGGRLFASMAILPWLVGALVGVVLVGREIEQRTATFAWSLSPDRRRWLLRRALVGAVLVALLLAVPSVVASLAEQHVYPWVAPESSFNDYGLRGHLVVARGVAAFALALLTGAVVGRQLPALLLAFAGCVGLAIVLAVLLPFGQPPEPIPEEGSSIASQRPLYAHSIPGGRLREVELREMLFLGGVTLVLVAATAAVVERRRPS